MSDDLVKRLRDDSGDWLTDLAADRIEELEAKLDWVITERDETFALMLDRAQTAEAKLAKAVTSLQHIAANKITDELTVIEWDTHDTFTVLDTCISNARTTLAELKGEKDA
jgi:SPX domain protein involved in polyphosphate accumulation